MVAPCCGARYASPNYVSMNFMAFEYWTDGWREGSLMPNDEGLRRCSCGQFLLKRDLDLIETAESSDLPQIACVYGPQLAECITKADSEDMEVAARLEYWRELNHPYRDEYRQHREAQEAATKAAWEAANPDRRTWWDKLRRQKAPRYRRPPDSPFTYPAFEPTGEQLQNMARLCNILLSRCSEPGRGGALALLTLAELYREQGLFYEAEGIICAIDAKEECATRNLITDLIKEKQTAPMRYRM